MKFYKVKIASYKPLLVLIATAMLFVMCKNDSNIAYAQGQDSNNVIESEHFKNYDIPELKWGFINKGGAVVIDPIYDDVRDMKTQLTAANLLGRWGYIDTIGNEKIGFRYKQVSDFYDERAFVKDFDNNWSIIDTKGKIIKTLLIDDFRNFVNNLAAVFIKNKWGVINKDGEYLIEATYDRLTSIEKDLFIAEKDGKKGIINSKGNILLELAFDNVYKSGDGLYRVKLNDEFYFLDNNFQKKSKNYKYATNFKDNRALVKENGLYTLLDKHFQVITELEMDNLYYLEEEMWAYSRNGKIGLMDHNGSLLTSPKFDQVNKFKGGNAVFADKDMWGYVNKLGMKLVPAKFPLNWDYHDGLARVIVNRGIGYLDEKYRLVISTPYFEARDFYNGIARFQEN